MKAEKRLYETADGRVVLEGDPAAAFLIAGEGGQIPDRTRERLNITQKSLDRLYGTAPKEEAPGPEPEPEPEPAHPAPDSGGASVTIKREGEAKAEPEGEGERPSRRR